MASKKFQVNNPGGRFGAGRDFFCTGSGSGAKKASPYVDQKAGMVKFFGLTSKRFPGNTSAGTYR